MKTIIDYVPSKKCKNPDVWYTCYKCGQCGRKFIDGIMVEDASIKKRKEKVNHDNPKSNDV